MKLSLSTPLLLTAVSLILLFVYLFMGGGLRANADDASLPATVATSSVNTVGTTPVLMFATSTCATRIISTSASPIMLTFTDRVGLVPTGIIGFLQAASTTVAYPSNQFGCNAVKAYSYVSGTVNVAESR